MHANTCERISFNAKTDINDLFMKVSSVKDITNDEAIKMISLFNKYGALILEHDESLTAEENLFKLKKYFGNVIPHERSVNHGIATISNQKGFDGYLGANNEDHPLHTGGTYSEEPPIVILLQCLKPSDIGGESILVSSKSIYHFLQENDPKGLNDLKKRGVVTIKRGKDSADRAIFDEHFLGNGSYTFSFRCDHVAEFYLKPCKIITTLALIKNFIDSAQNQIVFKLKRNQILIMDNCAVLHARKSFPADSDRCLQRLNVDGKDTRYPLILGFK